MRVIHVVPAVSEEASGPSYAVVRLCQSLIEAGTEVQVAALDWSPAHRSNPFVATFPLGLGPRRLGVSPDMRRWLNTSAASGELDLIHNHSLWMMPNVYSGSTCRRHRQCRLVVSPHGTLSPWALGFNALRKKIFWRLLQEPAVRHAACFHATSDNECNDIRRAGFEQPVSVLPNGIDIPALEKPAPRNRRQLLFLGRIHPVKGIDILLRAWSAVEDRFPDWDLHVAGPDGDGHLAAMHALGAQLKLERVVFRGPLYGEEKLRAFRTADLFVLPTRSENFGMAVAEALAAGTPAIVTVAAPWEGLTREGAGWSIDVGIDPLVACLEEALASSPDGLRQMGLAARTWMSRDYSWPRIGEQCATTYRWLLQGGDTPPWVRLH